MTIVATQKTAALTGVWSGVVAVFLGPLVDNTGPLSSLWLLVSVMLVSVPAFFFVFGVYRKNMVGLWMFDPALLKRVFVCLGGVVAVGLLAQLAWLVT